MGVHALHDQYEELVGYCEGMKYVVESNVYMYLIQTNSDIDMYRGGTWPNELYRNVFGTGHYGLRRHKQRSCQRYCGLYYCSETDSTVRFLESFPFAGAARKGH